MSHIPRLTVIALASALVTAAASPLAATEGWDPFGQLDSTPRTRRTPPAVAAPIEQPSRPDGRGQEPSSGQDTLPPPQGEPPRGVERGELAPVIASDGSGLPYELWRGLDVEALEGMLTKLDIPPRSPGIHSLWRRLITARVDPPSGAGAEQRFALVRAEALYRSGLIDTPLTGTAAAPVDPASNPALAFMVGRLDVGRGRFETGCEMTRAALARRPDLPKSAQGEALLITGICAAAGGTPAGAGLAAELAREQRVEDPGIIAALDAIAAQQKLVMRGAKRPLTLLQYRAAVLAGGIDAKDILERGEAALLASLARDGGVEVSLQLASAEAAARANSMTPEALATLYRLHGPNVAPEQLAAPGGSRGEPSLHRAALFKAAEAERTPLRKVRVMRAFLDDARRAGLYLQALEMLNPTSDGIQPVPEIGWFAETGIEIGLASGNLERARQWANLGGSVPGDGGLRHWMALIDLADPALKTQRGRSLASIEDLAVRGRLAPDLLHRLATVLDANDTNIPIPLWEAASRTPQPTGGYLPDTGVLTQLQEASKKKEFGNTVLLVMRALGPNGAEGANMISLGDSIRALRRAGLEPDARRLSLEALFAQWPRGGGN